MMRALRGSSWRTTEGSRGLQADDQPARDRLPDEGGPRAPRAGARRTLAFGRRVRRAAQACGGPSQVRPGRRPAVCKRRDPPRPCHQQGPQGRHRQVALARWLRFAVRARLGLPRPADRAADREEARPRGPEAGRGRLPQGLPRVCGKPGGHPADRVPAARRDRRLERSLPHDGLALRGGAAAGIRRHHPPRPPGARLQARALVPRLPLLARRGGSRIRGAQLARDRRALRDRRCPRCGPTLQALER
jgi:hypothetical protein